MYELKKKIGKVFTSKFVGTWPSSYKKRIYRAAFSQRLRNTAVKSSLYYPSFKKAVLNRHYEMFFNTMELQISTAMYLPLFVCL